MAGKTEAKPELTIVRVLDAPRARVFQAWIDPKQVSEWWGPRGFTVTFCELDVRIGGTLRICMRSSEGKDYWMRGVYREIAPPERLVFSHAWEEPVGTPGPWNTVTVSLEEEGRGTKLTVNHGYFDSVEERDSHHEGWSSCLEILAERLANA